MSEWAGTITTTNTTKAIKMIQLRQVSASGRIIHRGRRPSDAVVADGSISRFGYVCLELAGRHLLCSPSRPTIKKTPQLDSPAGQLYLPVLNLARPDDNIEHTAAVIWEPRVVAESGAPVSSTFEHRFCHLGGWVIAAEYT